MMRRALILAVVACLAATVPVHAQSKDKAVPASGKAAAPAMDAKAMEAMMAKAATPGPEHQRLQKLVGEWNLTVKSTMDPSQPAAESKATSVVTSLMDGRYIQEQSNGDMMGMPFSGMGLTGYDNVAKKYVTTWMDNMGTGIMKSVGTADATGNVITWFGDAPDPMTGKTVKYRMVSRFIDDNKHTFEMYSPGPNGKEMKMMEITYDRKM